MLNLPTMGELHLMQRERLTNQHSKLLNKILKQNSHKSKYWILGMVSTKKKNGKTRITPLMQVYDSMPEVQKESYLYEVDNIEGTKTLIWVMHPNNKLSLPHLNKSMSVSGDPV